MVLDGGQARIPGVYVRQTEALKRSWRSLFIRVCVVVMVRLYLVIGQLFVHPPFGSSCPVDHTCH
jgi:hypothetical protein